MACSEDSDSVSASEADIFSSSSICYSSSSEAEDSDDTTVTERSSFSAEIPGSSAADISSSSVAVSSDSTVGSSSSVEAPSTPCGDMWCGPKGDERVETGLGIDDTYGYWYPYDDGVSSELTLSDDSYGLVGSVTVGEGESPYAGIGFNITGEDQLGADVTAFGGLCIVYSSSAPLRLELGVENELDVTGGYNYGVNLPQSDSVIVKDFAWEKFNQPGWGDIGESETLTKLAAIKLKFSESGDFAVYSIGRQGTCK